MASFPQHRPRRLRRTAALRRLVRETRLSPANLIYPLFVCPGKGVRKAIGSMPGVFNLSVDETLKEAEASFRNEAIEVGQNYSASRQLAEGISEPVGASDAQRNFRACDANFLARAPTCA